MKRSILLSIVIGIFCGMPIRLCAMEEKSGDVEMAGINTPGLKEEAMPHQEGQDSASSDEESSDHECPEVYCCGFRCQCINDVDQDKIPCCGSDEFVCCDIGCVPGPGPHYCELSTISCQKGCKTVVPMWIAPCCLLIIMVGGFTVIFTQCSAGDCS